MIFCSKYINNPVDHRAKVAVLTKWFSRKPLLDEDSATWILECFAWAIRNTERTEFFEHTELITPSSRHFPDRLETTPDLAAALFTRVRDYAGMSEWECALVAQDPDPELHIAPTVILRGIENSPAGTFSVQDDGGTQRVEITYNPDLLKAPERLIATLAHELAHYLGATIEEPPPGGEEYHEHATDILSVVLGFGIFQLNSTQAFSGYSDPGSGMHGWSMSRLGYLSPKESAFALGIFCTAKGIAARDAERYLSDPQRGFFRHAMGDLAKREPTVANLLQENFSGEYEANTPKADATR